MLNFKKSLLLRITLPIVLLVLALGAILYFFVLATVSEFAKQDIEQDLVSQARRTYSICNINFDNLLLSGLADDSDALIIKQAITLGQIEDFFRLENLEGFVYDRLKDQPLFQTELLGTRDNPLDKGQKGLVSLPVDQEEYLAYFSDFQPWGWQIMVAKNAKVYSDMIFKVQQVYLYTLGSLMVITFFMIFFIFKSVHGPTRTIVKNIQKKQKPDYKGIDVFEFLSDTISRMMDSLQQSEEKYRILVENSHHLVWEMDLNCRYTFVSPTALGILGSDPDEILGKSLFYSMPLEEADQIKQYYDKKIWQKSGFEGLVTAHVHKSGRKVVLETTGLPVFNENREISGYRGIHRDITERVLAEQEKVRAQTLAAEQGKLALVGQVAGKMAHDFNNVLGIIMGNSELALWDCQDDRIKETLQLIVAQTLRGKNLTKNLIAFAKDQEPTQEFFKINETMDLVLSLVKMDLEGIEVTRDYGKEMPELLADPGMIEHALVNLIQNSIHAVSLVTQPQIHIQTYCLNENICLEIKDNGCGIPEDQLSRIFEPSFTLKGSRDVSGSYKKGIKGTGYGMSNIKKYIDQHKGHVSIESKFASGTRVVICLPMTHRELTFAEKIEIQQGKIQSSKRILLVEDEQAISDVQYQILTQEPFCHKVDLAHNGQAALDLWAAHSYDLISLDYILPGPVNGMDIYRQIRKTDKNIPILFISGNIEFLESIKELKQKDGHIDHGSKPCQNKEYVDRINKLLEQAVTVHP